MLSNFQFEEDFNPRRRLIRKTLQSIRARSVCQCGETDVGKLEYHHVLQHTKKFTLGRSTSKSIAAIDDELRKCAVVCTNCHRRMHHVNKDCRLECAAPFVDPTVEIQQLRNELQTAEHQRLQKEYNRRKNAREEERLQVKLFDMELAA